MKGRTSAVLVLAAGIAAPIRAQTPPATPMPYTAVHQPEFVMPSEVTFLQDDDIILGVVSGKVAKAFPAADLSQHGAVFDKLPDGPISVTWCVGGLPIVIVHQPSSDTTTAVDARGKGKQFQAAMTTPAP